MKAYLDFETKLKERLPREQRAKAKPTDISGGAMDGRALNYAEVERLKNLPTKQELIATIARLIKQVSCNSVSLQSQSPGGCRAT